VVNLLENYAAILRRDPPGEALADRDSDALLHLYLQPACGRRDQVSGWHVEQQHSGRIRAERLPHAIYQRDEQFLRAKPGQRGISNRLDVSELRSMFSVKAERWSKGSRSGDESWSSIRLTPQP